MVLEKSEHLLHSPARVDQRVPGDNSEVVTALLTFVLFCPLLYKTLVCLGPLQFDFVCNVDVYTMALTGRVVEESANTVISHVLHNRGKAVQCAVLHVCALKSVVKNYTCACVGITLLHSAGRPISPPLWTVDSSSASTISAVPPSPR